MNMYIYIYNVFSGLVLFYEAHKMGPEGDAFWIVYIYIYIYTHVHEHVYAYVYVYVYVYLYLYVYVYVYIYIYTYTMFFLLIIWLRPGGPPSAPLVQFIFSYTAITSVFLPHPPPVERDILPSPAALGLWFFCIHAPFPSPAT